MDAEDAQSLNQPDFGVDLDFSSRFLLQTSWYWCSGLQFQHKTITEGNKGVD
jgi:hypothetical protein